jgi:flagellar motor switch protein FliG
LKDKTPQDIAIVANYLDPAIAMRLLDLFPKDRQVEVALALGKEEINMEKVHALEESIKTRLAFVVGGENKLITLLDMTNEEVREKVMKKFEATDAQTAARLKQRIKSLETLVAELPALGIQTLYRNIDAALFAQVLKSLPAEVQQKVVSSLSAGAAERLKQEMDLSRPLSTVRLRREKQNLMVLVRRLISEGLVEVKNS